MIKLLPTQGGFMHHAPRLNTVAATLDEGVDVRLPLAQATKIAIKRLNAFLGNTAGQVEPEFGANAEGKAMLVSLQTTHPYGLQNPGFAKTAKDKLNELLRTNAPEVGISRDSKFNAAQTEAIIENLPTLARTRTS